MSNAAAAEAMYGHISGWDTSLITDMSWLFCGSSYLRHFEDGCDTAYQNFNEDIGAWNVGAVT